MEIQGAPSSHQKKPEHDGSSGEKPLHAPVPPNTWWSRAIVLLTPGQALAHSTSIPQFLGAEVTDPLLAVRALILSDSV